VAAAIKWDRTDPEVVVGGGNGKWVGGVGVRSDDDGVALTCFLSYMYSSLPELGTHQYQQRCTPSDMAQWEQNPPGQPAACGYR